MNRDNQAMNQGGSSRGRGTRGTGSSGRGFAAMDSAKQREIARKGGQASARSQVRDEQGQFGGKRDGASRSGTGSTRSSTGSTRSGAGSSNRSGSR
jgi:hypothetical protein